MNNFLPMLRERKVSEEDIATMLVANPARAFAYDVDAALSRNQAVLATTADDR
jgi:hypothetical protein